MDSTTWIIIIGVGLVAIIVAAVLFYLKKQKAMTQGFEQITEMLKQVPKQKKQSFILFTFRESARAGKNGKANLQSKMNDPKYVEVQLLQMNLILKDRTKVKDKKIKQALQMYDAYLTWEKSKVSKSKVVAK